MSNTIKYSESTEQRALNKGNWWIGTGDSNKGPSDVTGYYAGVTPPSSGYTIYIKREDNLPSIFVAQNDQELIFLTNQISELNFTTTQECLNYFQSQDDKLCINREIENIVTDGLVLNLDAGYVPSYPTSGTTWHDLSGNGNDGSLVNGPIYSGGSMVFDGVDDTVIIQNSVSLSSFTEISFNFWIRFYNLDYENNTGVLYSFLRKGDVDDPPTDPPTPHYGFWVSYDNRLNRNLFSYFAFGNDAGGWNGGGNSFTSVRYTFNNNQWYNISATVDSEELGKLYINSELQGTVQFSDVNLNTSSNISTYLSRLLDYPITQVYNRALTSEEVLQNYNAQKGRFGL